MVFTRDHMAAGFVHIREKGPKSNNQNQFVEWTEMEINDEASPIFKWERGAVKESVRNYAAGEMLAKTIEDYPLTLKNLQPWFSHDVLKYTFSSLDSYSVVWVGSSGIGNTPAEKAVAMALSRHNVAETERDGLTPGFRTTINLDFFKYEPGSLFSRTSSTTGA